MDLFKLYFVLLVKSHIKSYPCPLQILIQHIIKFSFLLEKSIMDGVYVIFILVEHHLSFFSISTSWKSYVLWFVLLFIFYLVFRNSSSWYLNSYSIYGLCLTFWTNEFLGSYSNYKFIISFSIFSRMGLWRILSSLSNIEEVLCLSFYLAISPLWFSFSSSFLSSFSIF